MLEKEDIIWRALADPLRRSVLDVLRAGPRTTGALCALYGQTRFGVMKHLNVLAEARLILVEKRGRERWNYLNAAALRQATERWLSPFQSSWADRLMLLAQHLRSETPDKETPSMSFPEGLGFDVRLQLQLAAPRARVFAALTHDIGKWWISPYRQTRPESLLTLEPKIGAPLLEIADEGAAVIWGHIIDLRPPERLGISGLFAVPGAVAGYICFTLEDAEGGTLLQVSHRAMGVIDEETRGKFATGWQDLLGTRLRDFLHAEVLET
jgi:DNA-binding transcriptional ArsR family regulator/uncharacterized protein YndB with AHSA1/START domain